MCDDLASKLCQADILREKLMQVEADRDILIKALRVAIENDLIVLKVHQARDGEIIKALGKAKRIVDDHNQKELSKIIT